MRISDPDWQELKAAYDAVETYAKLAGLLGVSEKTATAWLMDRTREVREGVFTKALQTLRARRQNQPTSRGVPTDTKNRAGTEESVQGALESDAARRMSSSDASSVSTVGQAHGAGETTTMGDGRQKAITALVGEIQDPEALDWLLKQIVGKGWQRRGLHQSTARSREPAKRKRGRSS